MGELKKFLRETKNNLIINYMATRALAQLIHSDQRVMPWYML